MKNGKYIKQAMFLHNANRGSLTPVGVAYYSRLGMRRTKVLLKTLKSYAQ